MTISDEKLYNPTYNDITDACIAFVKQIKMYNIEFDAIIGVSRGGLVPANILSHALDIPLIPVSYSSFNGKGDDRNHENVLPPIADKKLLIIDDICDSGHTLRELADHYSADQLNTVYTACIYYKLRKNPVIVTNFSWLTINEDSPWIVFPWEVGY